MFKRALIQMLIGGALIAAPFASSADAFDVFGLVLSEARNSAIQIEPCGDSVCG